MTGKPELTTAPADLTQMLDRFAEAGIDVEALRPEDPHKRAIEFADKQYAGRRAAHVAAYWAAADGFEAGWKACEDLYEGRR